MALVRTLAILAALFCAGCVTPSIPIPPPEPERMVFAVDATSGTASFTFEPTPSYGSAVVYVFNRSLGVGVIDTARSDGSVGPTEPFAAMPGHEIVITFDLGPQLASTCVRLQDGRSSSGLECEL